MPTHCPITVAIAAPRMPRRGKPSRPKIMMGSRMMLVSAPATSDTMLRKVFPTACRKRWHMVSMKVPEQNSMQISRYCSQ